MAEDLQKEAASKAIDVGGSVIVLVVAAAVVLAVVGGNLIEFVGALL